MTDTATDVRARLDQLAQRIYDMDNQSRARAVPSLLGALKGMAMLNPDSVTDAVYALEIGLNHFEAEMGRQA